MANRSSQSFINSAKKALKDRFSGRDTPNAKGYVQSPNENLLSDIELNDVEPDLRAGAGDELRMKFCAVHSSAALAVNSFGYFKQRPQLLRLLGLDSFRPPTFERQCPTGLGGTPPNLDVWLQSDTNVVAVESKLLEYFTPKVAKYSKSYTRQRVNAEDCWWSVLEDSKNRKEQHLDVGQLVKHYLGLRRFLSGSPQLRVTLFYVYWEPSNADDISICIKHREEIERLEQQVADSQIQFAALSYPTVWAEWTQVPGVETHARNLITRYGVPL